jgi:mercuric ion transport protein
VFFKRTNTLMNGSGFLKKIALGGGIIAAITSSLCCLGPLVFVGLGLGGFVAAGMFEKWRPVFLIATVALLALAWCLTYRKPGGACVSGATLADGPAPKGSKVVLWCSTAVALTAAAFPNFAASILPARCGATCCASAGIDDKNTDPIVQSAESVPKDLPSDRISVYAVPLVCPAALQIGCGSQLAQTALNDLARWSIRLILSVCFVPCVESPTQIRRRSFFTGPPFLCPR